jgi:O-antigen/teichoic acid export membrane protein
MSGVAVSRRFGWVVARTSIFNVAAAVVAGVAGILIARSLGPSARGEYAAVMAWFGVVLVLGELGQPAATTFFVAREPDRAADYVATARSMMVGSGAVALVAGLLAAPLLAAGSGAATAGYRLMFATCLVSFAAASYVFGLQAARIARWNLARISQPIAYLVLVTGLHLAGHLDLMTALAVLAATIAGQAGLAYWLCAREGLTGGRSRRALARPLSRYGLSQLAAAAPTLVTARLDVLVLSLTMPPAALGHYAIAASVTALALPVVSAIGNVSFPRIASRTLSPERLFRLQRFALLVSAAVGVVLLLPVVVSAPVLVPLVFGAGFRDAVPLVVLLAPGGVLLACGRVCADLLKGHGRPLAVAGAQGAAALSTIVMLAALVPLFGVTGAAVTTSVAAGVALLLMLRALRRVEVRAPPACRADVVPRPSEAFVPSPPHGVVS